MESQSRPLVLVLKTRSRRKAVVTNASTGGCGGYLLAETVSARAERGELAVRVLRDAETRPEIPPTTDGSPARRGGSAPTKPARHERIRRRWSCPDTTTDATAAEPRPPAPPNRRAPSSGRSSRRCAGAPSRSARAGRCANRAIARFNREAIEASVTGGPPRPRRVHSVRRPHARTGRESTSWYVEDASKASRAPTGNRGVGFRSAARTREMRARARARARIAAGAAGGRGARAPRAGARPRGDHVEHVGAVGRRRVVVRGDRRGAASSAWTKRGGEWRGCPPLSGRVTAAAVREV